MCENVGFECVKMFAKGVKMFAEGVKNVKCVIIHVKGVKFLDSRP